MKRETLKLKPEFIGKAIYKGQEAAPERIDDTKGRYVRHVLFNEEHGLFHVITKATSVTYPVGGWVEVVNPLFYPDTSVNGANMTPANNVIADSLKIVQ